LVKKSPKRKVIPKRRGLKTVVLTSFTSPNKSVID
jgi:hypothetical protein